MEYYSAIKNEEILTFATTWMDLEGVMLNMSDRESQILYYLNYMWNLKRKQNKAKQNKNQTYRKSQTCGYQR